ncbi:uncharacterized protein LOC121177454 [Toxotes jaculatrix]|uniref:uncharacterized protein LOC121177454 n=1 Tax=Toxotes jaculatrix TaxID=941984 RepID=UPI001B3AFCA2|nr:uncharacterized protein LOC121177454 [Toxotes jaculatrix]
MMCGNNTHTHGPEQPHLTGLSQSGAKGSVSETTRSKCVKSSLVQDVFAFVTLTSFYFHPSDKEINRKIRIHLIRGAASLNRGTPAFSLTSAVHLEKSGQPRLISPAEPIIAAPGDDVILPCYLVPPFDVHRFTVEWSKPDLKPDPSDRLSRVEYVHLYRDRREVLDMKLRSYLSRTALFRDDLKHGNISLMIRNVTSEDEGRYKCFIPKLASPVKESIVRLVVDPNLVKTWTTETPPHPRDLQIPDPEDETDGEDIQSSSSRWVVPVASCVVLCLAAAAGVCGYFFIQQRKETDGVKYDIAPKNPSPA